MFCTAALVGCGGGSSSSSSSSSSTSVLAAYPSGLAVEAPTATDEGTSLTASIQNMPQGHLWERVLNMVVRPAYAATPGVTPAFSATTERINEILNGSTLVTTHFNPKRLMRTDTNANCYGPQMVFDTATHPDGSTGASPLPGGDVGLWTASESASGNACAVAQLNARMRGVSARSSQAMIALAMLVKRAHLSSSGLPAAGATVDVLSSMPSIPSVTWSAANLSQPTAGNYTYNLQFSFADGAVTRRVDLSLSHSSTSSSVYAGLMRYALTGDNTGGNCPLTSTTLVGTLKYQRTSDTDMNMSHRSGVYCGTGTTAGSLASDRGATFESDGQLNPSSKYNSGTQKGWADNFNRFGGSLNPNTRAGTYLYAWQAGYGDSHSRLLQVKLAAPLSSTQTGEAYFGFAKTIDDAALGDLLGMICNWAGPNALHTPSAYVQRQAFSQGGGVGTWVSEATPQIRYAPANSCTYAGTNKWYDRTLNGNLSDEVNADVQVATSDTNFLMGKSSFADIAAAIAARPIGYTKPSMY